MLFLDQCSQQCTPKLSAGRRGTESGRWTEHRYTVDETCACVSVTDRQSARCEYRHLACTCNLDFDIIPVTKQYHGLT